MTHADNKKTSVALATFMGTQAIDSDNAAYDGTLGLVLWGVQNPGEYLALIQGKTPKAFKVFRANAIAKSEGRDSKVRRMVTAGKAAGAAMFGDGETDAKAFADSCARVAESFKADTILQALNGPKDSPETGLRAIVIAKTGCKSNAALIDLGKPTASDDSTPTASDTATPAPAPDEVEDAPATSAKELATALIKVLQDADSKGKGDKALTQATRKALALAAFDHMTAQSVDSVLGLIMDSLDDSKVQALAYKANAQVALRKDSSDSIAARSEATPRKAVMAA